MSSKIAADMPGSLKTEAVVLRSIRYGEADRILHLYTPDLGRIGAIAKGVRRARSRFGGRLEPCSRVALVLHQGRSDLMTVTGADTIASNAHLREHGRALDGAVRACDAVNRLFGDGEPHPPAYHLLCNELGARIQEGEIDVALVGGRPLFPVRTIAFAIINAYGKR